MKWQKYLLDESHFFYVFYIHSCLFGTFEVLECVGVELIGLRDVLDELLDDDAIVDACVAGIDLDVIVAGERGHLDGLLRGRLELLTLDAQLLDARAVQLAQNAHDARLLARAVGAIHQQVRKVIGVHQLLQLIGLLLVVLERAQRLRSMLVTPQRHFAVLIMRVSVAVVVVVVVVGSLRRKG